LQDEHYQAVVASVEGLSQVLPADFIISFKDGLLRPIVERSFTLSGFTCEYFKGHHLVIQPDGNVQRAARGWGRTWRADECIGNVNQTDLHDILTNEPPTLIPLEFTEETRRKYRLMDVSQAVIDGDLADVASVREGHEGDLSDPDVIDWSRVYPSALLPQAPLLRLESLARGFAADPGRYRLRQSDDDAALLFDAQNFEIHVLSNSEVERLAAAPVS
jgi:hypothetical protein